MQYSLKPSWLIVLWLFLGGCMDSDLHENNTAPSFTNQATITATENETYIYNITTVDLDVSDTLTITAITKPDWLTLTDKGDKTATLSGTPTTTGSVEVQLQVSDGTTFTNQNFTIDIKTTTQGLVALYGFDSGAQDDSEYSGNGAMQGKAAIVDENCLKTSCIKLNGGGDWVQIDNNTEVDITNNQITLMAWVKINKIDGDVGIVLKNESNPEKDNYALIVSQSRFVSFRTTTESGMVRLDDSANRLELNEWYHLAGSYDGATMKVYINGELILEEAQSGNIISTNEPLLIGRRALGDERFFSGWIDEVSVWSRGLSLAEIKSKFDELAIQSSTGSRALSIPTELTASAISTTQINLNWNDSNNAAGVTGYKIFRDDVEIAISEGNSYVDTGLTASTTYAYAVSVYDTEGNVSSLSSASSATTLSANGSLSRFDVSTTVGAGGSINPNSIALNSGDIAVFFVMEDNGYSVSSVSGCGGTLSGNSYTTAAVTGACTIVAIFNSNAAVESTSFMQAVADGDAAPVMINGQAWTFRTPPPPENERTVRADHPRLMITQDTLPALKIKLMDPVYSSYITKITARADKGSMLENAFLYQITGEISRANAAKQTLLNYSGTYGETVIFGYDKMSRRLGPILVFDWIMDTLTSAEKLQIFANVKDNFNYDHKTASARHSDGKGPGTYPWYWNDVYNRLPEIYLPSLAFTIAGDGIDDAWADEVIAWAYDEDETRVVGPYGANRGSGFLDVLMTMSLDTGGFSDAATEYYSYWMEAVHAVAFWESATGQPMWSRSPWLKEGPQSLLTSREGMKPSARIRSAIEFVTGMYDGDTASLAKYVVNYFGGPSKYHTVHRAIFGDMRVVEKTPAEVNIPTAKYLRGDHVFYSKDSWEDDAVSLYVRSPYINVGRGPGSEGVFAIDIGKRQPLAPRVRISKTQETAGYSSGMWIYDPTRTVNETPKITPTQNKGTYWGWQDSRSYEAWITVSEDGYFEGAPNIEITNDYRAISMEYGQRYDEISVTTAQRTIVHIPDGDRNFIVVYDYVDVPSNLKSAWQMRLMEGPSVNGRSFTIPGVMNATVVSPVDSTIEWLGDLNKEFVTPSPEQQWYTSRRGGSVPGYSLDRPNYISAFGLGNIYIQPAGQKDNSVAPYVQQTEYLVVIEIGDLAPVSVTRISDREVIFAGWQVSFFPDGSYTVSN